MQQNTCWAMFFTAAWFLCAAVSECSVCNLRTDYLVNPLGIDNPAPRFFWELRQDDIQRGTKQLSYLIYVKEYSTNILVWSPLAVNSSQSFQIQYSGPPLRSGVMYAWGVELVVQHLGGEPTAMRSDEQAIFSMGMLAPSDWTAVFVGMRPPLSPAATNQTSNADIPSPWFRTTFWLPSVPTGRQPALLYVASVGYHEASVNGQPVTDAVLLPSISYLPRRVLYRTYDVGRLLRPGRNSIGVWAAKGWATTLYWGDVHELSRLAPLVLAELRIGDAAVASSGASWKCQNSSISHTGGPYKYSDLGGDALDASAHVEGWDAPDFDDSAWPAVVEYARFADGVAVSADAMEPTVRHSAVRPVSLESRPPRARGELAYLVAMRELYTGWFQVANLSGVPGSVVRFQVSTTSASTSSTT